MPVEIKITDDDIRFAQNQLLSKGFEFDDERKKYIANFETIDLHAVPGSGKTTALLAKLLITEKYMPFSDGSGVLVISHTNAAVNQIKEKLQKHCPKLFGYPNFVGTIQSFVDQYLTIPFCHHELGKRISWIDSDRYRNKIYKKFCEIYWDKNYDQPGKMFYCKHINRAKKEAVKNNKSEKEVCNKLVEQDVKRLVFDFRDETIKFIDTGEIILRDKSNKKYIGLKKIILECLYDGIISFEYAYIIADFYVYKYPKVKNLLQKRFSYVFVDEMQDMNANQLNILENIFYDNNESSSVFQRIGDKNQAIYDGQANLSEIWKERTNFLELNGSYRLSQKIANAVQPFAVNPIGIQGRGVNKDGSQIEIPPHILLYNNSSIWNVIKTFALTINDYQDQGSLSKDIENKYFAVAWNTIPAGDGKIRLIDYFNDYSWGYRQKRNDLPFLESYINFCSSENNTSMNDIHNTIFDVLTHILHLENIVDDHERAFTKRSLERYLKKCKEREYHKFIANVFTWCKNIQKKESFHTINAIRKYTPEFLALFNKEIVLSKEFIFGNSISLDTPEKEKKENCYSLAENDEIKIHVSTVHATKGQTHTATLYLETYYKTKYESQRLFKQFKGLNCKKQLNNVTKQSAKMVYVGFSRPTHLLCFALHEDRYKETLENLDTNIWKIIKVQ